MRDDRWPWLMRAIWIALPFTAGRVLGDALDEVSQSVGNVMGIGLWVGWAVGMVLVWVPHTLTLTPFRVIVPTALAATIWATVVAGASGWAAAGLSLTAAGTLVALSAQLGSWFVNGSSYGDERRVPLRPPGALLAGPIPLFWAALVAGVVSGPLLLAGEQWVLGAPVTAIGIAIAAVAARSLHSLARRWLVFVPAGLVIHDHMSLTDPVLFKRTAIVGFGPALADSDAHDLSQGALGLALELRFRTPVELGWRENARAAPVMEELEAVIVSPSRPGAALREAQRRGIAVG